MFNKLRNKRIQSLYPDNEFFFIDNKVLVLLGNEYELNDENKGKYYYGDYRLINNSNFEIGHMYYIIKTYNNSAFLSDIEISYNYRKRGLASKLLTIFENSCKNHNIEYITGKLSSIDEHGNKKQDRDEFYLHRGYTILNGDIYKSLID